MGRSLLRAAGACSVALVVMIAACSSDEEPAPVTPGVARPTGHPPLTMDELEAELLGTVGDEDVPMTPEQLDQDFPLLGLLTEPEKQLDRDPTKGDSVDVEKAFA